MNTVKILFTVGNALMTIGSVVALGNRIHYFSKRVQYHNGYQPTNYTRPARSYKPES